MTEVWIKSSHSHDNGCVEVRIENGRIHVRDSKDRLGLTLTFNPEEWGAFLAGVRSGEFEVAR